MQHSGPEVRLTKRVIPEETDLTLEDEQEFILSGALPPTDKGYDDISDFARMKRFIPIRCLTTNDEEELVRRGIVAPPGRRRS